MRAHRKLVYLAFTFWTVVITVRYSRAVLQSVGSPFNEGADVEWLVVWLAIAVFTCLAITLRRLLPLALGLLIAACLTITILSGAFMSAVMALWIFVLAWAWGLRILQVARVQIDDAVEAASVAVPLGLLVLALAAFGLALVHLLTTFWIWVLLLGLSASQGRALIRLIHLPALTTHKPGLGIWFPLMVSAPVVVLNLVWAVAPEVQFDAINYHLAVPRIYLDNAGFIDLPYFFQSYLFRLVEMLFAIGLGLHDEVVAKLISFGLGLIAACGVFTLGKLIFDTRTGCWAAAFFYTTPVVSWLSGTTYIDHAVAVFLTAGIIAFFRWRNARERMGWIYTSALLAGAAVGTKLTAVYGLPVLFGFLILSLWRGSAGRMVKTSAMYAVLFLVVILPWYGLTYYWTGNPVFPLLNGVFKSPLWDTESRLSNSGNFGIGSSPSSLLRLPFRLTFDSMRFGESSPSGSAGVALLLAFPFSVGLLLAGTRNTGLLLITSFIYLLLWAYSFQYVRYYVPILPVISILGVATVFHFSELPLLGTINRVCLMLALIMQFPTTSIQFWNIPERFPIAVALGRETREHFLERALGGYATVKYLNEVTKAGDRLLGVDVEQFRFYLNVPLETFAGSTGGSVSRTAAGMSPDERLLRRLKEARFSHILVRRGALKDPPAWYPYLKPDFLDQFTVMEFSDESTLVYRLKM